MPVSRWFCVALVFVISASCPVAPIEAAEAAVRAAAARAITSDKVKTHVDALADDTFEGREAGTRGSRAAAGYIVAEIQKFGLPGGGPRASYYQQFGSYRNILAFAEGSDPKLKDQVIVISAHYDHVGYGTNRNSYGPTGHIHNGADDNASGVSGLLEVMEAVSQLPQRPKRSILFAFWDGEEKGLLGSEHWVAHPTVPLDRVPIMLNVDMIGRLRNQQVEVIGVRTSPGLRRRISEVNDPDGLRLVFEWDIRPDSDHQPFFSHGIPFLMLHTGKHPDYHRPSDDAHLINNDGLSRISQLMFHLVVELADAPTLGPFRSASRTESNGLRHMRERGLAPPPGAWECAGTPSTRTKTGRSWSKRFRRARPPRWPECARATVFSRSADAKFVGRINSVCWCWRRRTRPARRSSGPGRMLPWSCRSNCTASQRGWAFRGAPTTRSRTW